jgi:hypothetical protein
LEREKKKAAYAATRNGVSDNRITQGENTVNPNKRKKGKEQATHKDATIYDKLPLDKE